MNDYILFAMIGFGAQLIDGGLGMGYGLISMTALLAFGVSPAMASAGVHTAEIFTTGISGLSHMMFKNIDHTLFRRLVIPGILGGFIGAHVLTKTPTELIKPFLMVYLFVMGMYIFYKAFQHPNLSQTIYNYIVYDLMKREKPTQRIQRLIPLGFIGGFLDAAGGGGWGAIVNSTLLAQGEPPRYTLGSVNLAEFLVTLSISATFFFTIGIKQWPIILGLVTGGAIAAPIAAYMVRIIPANILKIIIGLLIILLSLRALWQLVY